MTQNTDPIPDSDLRDRDVVYAERPVVTTSPDIEHRSEYVTTTPVIADRPSRVPAFIAGFISAIVLAAIAFGTFLVVSDSDDDGNIDVDVPAVDVSTG